MTSSMDLLIEETATAFKGDIAPGDVMLCNDPYRGNTHVGDLVVLAPVFVDGRHLFWSCARAHQLDIGAPLPTTTTPWAANVWQEGPRRPAAEDLRRRQTPRRRARPLPAQPGAGATCWRAT